MYIDIAMDIGSLKMAIFHRKQFVTTREYLQQNDIFHLQRSAYDSYISPSILNLYIPIYAQLSIYIQSSTYI